MKCSLRFFVVISCFLSASVLKALPIGFGVNQGDLIYKELASDHFITYFDQRTPKEAAMVSHTLEAAKPIVEGWLGVLQTKKLPVILSAVSDGASFANMVTDAIELQTMGRGDRDLFLHEYTHIMMYRHHHNFLGPVGSIFHLLWLPAWWIEGLAEAFSFSVPSDITFGIERYQALSEDWPSYDRLHQLYGTDAFSQRGYATAGAFVRWILKQKKDPDFLVQFMTRLNQYTYPQHYIFTLSPLESMMPIDRALRDFFGEDGRSLYKRYQKERKDFWSKEIQEKSVKMILTDYSNKTFNPSKPSSLPASDLEVFTEEDLNQTKICYRNRSNKSVPFCFAQAELPKSVYPIGFFDGKIFYALTEQHLDGDRARLYFYDTIDKTNIWVKFFPKEAVPVSMINLSKKMFILVKEHGFRSILEIDPHGMCLNRMVFSDLILSMEMKDHERAYARIWTPEAAIEKQLFFERLSKDKFCSTIQPITSPLMEAFKHKNLLALADALDASDFSGHTEEMEAARSLSLEDAAHKAQKSPVAAWRPKHILTLPFIGAEDPISNQIGFVSVPLVDDLQNETLRITFLYGTKSLYPNTKVTFTSNRFQPSIELSVLRQQIYNGYTFNNDTNRWHTSYVDGKGIELSADLKQKMMKDLIANMSLNLSSIHRKRLIGGSIREGMLYQLSAGLSIHLMIKELSCFLQLTGSYTPQLLAQNYDFNRLSFLLQGSHPINIVPRSHATIAFSGSRVRAYQDKAPELREFYTPQRAFIAGGGGGNQNSFTLLGVGSLFDPRFGDQKIKLEAKWQMPVIEHVEKQIWLFYLDRLMLSTFINKGGAWWQDQNFYDRMLSAYGSSLDLFLENKGVKFNTGLGVGKVANDHDWQFYASAGFDALF